MKKNHFGVIILIAILLPKSQLMADEIEVVREERINVVGWSAQVVQKFHGPRESDAIFLDVMLVENTGLTKVLAINLVGPIIVFEKERKILSCEANNIIKGDRPVILDLEGRKWEGPKHPGYLRDCYQIEGSNLLLLHYNLVKNGKPYNLARLLSTGGRIVLDKEVSGSSEFNVLYEGKTYRVRLPEPEWPG